MTIPRKRLAIQALAASSFAALLLTSCGATQEDPAAIMSDYVEHLNSGDFDKALALVHDSQDITADSLVKLEGVEVPEPTTEVEAFEVEEGTQKVMFQAQAADGGGSQKSEVTFVNLDGQWRIKDPHFITAQPDGTMEQLISAGATISSDDGADMQMDTLFVTP